MNFVRLKKMRKKLSEGGQNALCNVSRLLGLSSLNSEKDYETRRDYTVVRGLKILFQLSTGRFFEVIRA